MTIKSVFFIFVSLVYVSGCASVPSPKERLQILSAIASKHNLHSKIIQTSHFSLYSLFDTAECKNQQMRIYIEGDGFAWSSRSRLSDDPTPINPMAAKFMGIDPSHCKVYLARPCQYVQAKGCESSIWSNRRFSTEVIESYNKALNQLKQEMNNTSFSLVGYSGGGAVAVLTASGRNDIDEIITLAGNLDIDAWVRHHSLAPLDGSLNPADYAHKIENIPQWNLYGKKDSIIPASIAQSYLQHCKNRGKIYLLEVDSDHSHNWEGSYKLLLQKLKDNLHCRGDLEK